MLAQLWPSFYRSNQPWHLLIKLLGRYEEALNEYGQAIRIFKINTEQPDEGKGPTVAPSEAHLAVADLGAAGIKRIGVVRH